MRLLIGLLFFPLMLCSSDKKKTVASTADESHLLTAKALEKNESFAVVQLFTSQGCSSCPSADKLLDDVKDQYAANKVAVLSYHVDYWNRLGWRDPFSSSEYTALQNEYANKFNSRSLYTPQAVINGKVHFVGSSEGKMNGYLSKFLKTEAENTITISNISKNSDDIKFSYDATGDTSAKKIKVALVIAERTTPIKRGENGGLALKNSNIVIEEITLSNSTGKGAIKIPALVEADDELILIAYLQKSDLEITGVTQVSVE